ncbi:hypothetical protein [Bacillus pinisoli]|uniref:hypothetical protein n=1 Tax=Bacillus pinisoli TaxID=2901866 RepID=UPI001FF15390|nr:hypothetical protein [Bacillus pinisoli]
MFEITQLSSFDYATIAAVVAAFVTVLGNAFSINKKYRALLAIFLGLVIVCLPQLWAEKLLTALIIGLTASGVYSQVKPRDNENELLKYETLEQINKKKRDSEETPY